MEAKQKSHEYNCKIYYEDVDVGGYCYHSKYLNFCERARSEIFFSQGHLPIFEDYHFVAKKLEANFKSPGFFGDEIRVITVVKELTKVSVTMSQEVVNQKGVLIFQMDILLVCLNNNKISKIPDTFVDLFKMN